MPISDRLKLKDYHLFSREGEYYLLNIDDMTSFIIDGERHGALSEIKGRPFDAEKHGSLFIYLSLLDLIERKGGKEAEELPVSFPIGRVTLNVTQECNLSCRYCFGVRGEYGNRGHMSRETAFDAVDWLMRESAGNDSPALTFFGGEPLLRFDLIREVVGYAEAGKNEKTISFGITTNGTLLNDQIIEFLKKHDFRVSIGFDAVERLQNQYRPFKNGSESFETVRKNISDLIKAGAKSVNITCMVSDEKTDFREARQALIETGCASMGIHRPAPPILKSDDAEHMEIFNTIRSGDVKDYTERQLLSIEEEGRDWLISVKERNIFSSKVFSGITGQLHARSKKQYFCSAGKGMVNISISGDIYPCHRFNGLDHMKMGSIWSFDAESQRRYAENHTSRISECRRCHARHFCGAGCLHANLAVRGGIDKPYGVWCDMIKRAVEAGVAIYHQLDVQDIEYLKSRAFGSRFASADIPDPLDDLQLFQVRNC